jgi:hypothetical protein
VLQISLQLRALMVTESYVSSTNFAGDIVKWKTGLSQERTKFVPDCCSESQRTGKPAFCGVAGIHRKRNRNKLHEGVALGILLWGMQILFAISVLCFVALAWACFAVVRHIRANHTSGETSETLHPDFSQHLVAAVESGDASSPPPFRQQTAREILAAKSWNQPPASVTVRPTQDRPDTEYRDGERKPAQAVHHAGNRRADRAYFNSDAGDLSDPYPRGRIRSDYKTTSPRRY